MNKFRFCCIFFIIIFLLYLGYVIAPGPNNQNIKIYIDKSSKFGIAETLYQNGVIREKYIFWATAQLLRLNGPMQAGEYEFDTAISPIQIILKMQAGDVVTYQTTIPEGLTTVEIISLLKEDPNLTGDIDKIFQEGELLPSTFYFNSGYSKLDLLYKMKTAMSAVLELYWEKRDLTVPFKNQYEALILASIVEKETEHDEERPRVAAVFINRLKKGMKLQADPTTIYAITQGKYKLERSLTRKDLQINSLFNTYFIKGLPPTPICNPGIKSIIAVLQPIKTDDLYFVLNKDGKHNFSPHYLTHLKNVQEYYLSKSKTANK
jgi:UPF0755 protein